MSDARAAALSFIRQNQENHLQTLRQLLAIPTVSTDPAHRQDMVAAAEWLAGHLRGMGFDASVYPTSGHPVVYAEYMKAGPGLQTVLIYGHYDVQPPEPVDLWHTSPFEPSLEGENLFARGASDMKGQVLAAISAVKAILAQGTPPVNIKFILEGEEEIGSPNLPAFLKAHADLLRADFVLNPDAGMISAEMPTIVYGLRGLAYFELRVFGPEHDLHSGMYGGVVHNPAQALCELLAGMHAPDGSIALPGFYDSVRPLEQAEREELARLPLGDDFYLRNTGAPALWGEKDYTAVERASSRPTLEVHGLLSGFTGAGTKTVIPAWALAKISCRLVPDQQPEAVHQQLLRYLQEHAPATIRWELTAFGGGPACIADLDLPATRALAAAMQTVWGVPPVFKREGGSIPVVADMQEILGIQSVLTGFGLPDDNVHAPNEKLHLPTWYRGQEALVNFFYNL